jgi:serine O-acetyltransferase
MKKIIEADLFRHGGQTSILKGLRFEGFRYMYFLRKAAKFKKISFWGIFYRLIVKRYSYKYGFQIPVNTNIGGGFYIGHFGTIIINERAKIGKNCNIAPNTTIGQANRGKLKGYPTIGDYVWIGTGSVIVGNIRVGNNVLIAPNAFVNIDVPDNSIVLGNPARIIDKQKATEGYIEHIINHKDEL